MTLRPILKSFPIIALCSLFGGCETTSANPATAVDAKIPAMSDASMKELTETISGALNGRAVRLSPDTFKSSSRAIIERRTMMGPDGNPIMGRDLSRPDHFYLKSQDGACWLYHQQTDTYYPLKSVECEALKAE